MVIILLTIVDIEEDPTFQVFKDKKKGRSRATIEGYLYSLKGFCNYVDKTPTEIHDICKAELRKNVPEFDQWILEALESYVLYMIDENRTVNGVKKQLSRVKGFLHALHIKPTPDIEVNMKPITEDPNELLSVEDIRKAIKYSNPTYQTIFITQCQTGLAISDTLLLDVGDFIKAVSDKKEELTLKEAIYRVKSDSLIGCFDLTRKKTSNHFYTFASPEALRAIAALLEDRDEYLTPNSPIFLKQVNRLPLELREKGFTNENMRLTPQAAKDYVTRMHTDRGIFPEKKVNGKTRRHFRTHKLRKWYSNQLYITDLKWEDIKFLMGQRTNDVLEQYINTNNYNSLKSNYRKALPFLAINDEIIMEENQEAIESLTKELQEERRKRESMEKKIQEMDQKNRKTDERLNEILTNKAVLEEIRKRE